jgi:hypothetical protein
MKKLSNERNSERGSAAIKFTIVFLAIVMLAHAGWNYIPVAYQGASFRQEMDTAVVKGLAVSGRINPLDTVTASIRRASADNNVPPDAFVEIKPVNGVVQAHVSYTREINMLPFGMYKYAYNFDHVARPSGYLMKE